MAQTADSFADGEGATTLTNVVRAGQGLPLEFFAPGTYTATRSATLGVGLPAITIGPFQTAAQHQAVFGTNSASNVKGYSATTSPIVTQEFTNSLLTQVSEATLGSYLDQGFSRAVLFPLFVENIEVSNSDGSISEILRNDPTLDDAARCPESGDYNPASLTPAIAAWVKTKDELRSADKSVRQKAQEIQTALAIRDRSGAGCEFHRVKFYLQLAIAAGLGIRRDAPAAQPTAVPAALPISTGVAPVIVINTQPAPAKPKAAQVGTFCFSSAAIDDLQYTLLKAADYAKLQKCVGALNAPSPIEITIHNDAGAKVAQTIKISLRSPLQMFRYVGSFAGIPAAPRSAGVVIEQRLGVDCAIWTRVHHLPYCVPSKSRATVEAITILNLLIRQSTAREDVPKSVTLTL